MFRDLHPNSLRELDQERKVVQGASRISGNQEQRLTDGRGWGGRQGGPGGWGVGVVGRVGLVGGGVAGSVGRVGEWSGVAWQVGLLVDGGRGCR